MAFGLALGKLGLTGGKRWSESALWPLGASSPGMWIDPPYTASLFQDSTGTTALSAIGTVLDTDNPVGLVLDRKGGLELGPEVNGNPGPFVNTIGYTGDGSTLTAAVGLINSQNLQCSIYYDDGIFVAGKTYKVSIIVAATDCPGDIYLVTTLAAPWTGVVNTAIGPFTGSGQVVSGYWTPTSASVRVGIKLGHANGTTLTISSFSVREIPGIHLSQATSTSRPVASGRVNLLTKTEDFADVGWVKSGGLTVVTPGAIAPDGTATAFDVTFTAGIGASQLYRIGTTIAAPSTQRVYLRSATGVNIFYGAYDGGGTGGGGGYITLTSTWTAYDVSLPAFTGLDRRQIWLYSNADGQQFQIWHPQINLGSTALPYQRVNTASDYDASSGPTYAKLDGTDDGWLSATFTANTAFTAGVDALIAVRRDSTAACVAGLYNAVADATKFFGMAESGSGSGCVGSGAGTPTVWVDGAQLAGGTAVTRGTLHTALTPGMWHILEFRNLDLSTWTAIGFGLYTSYTLNGAYGGHKVFSNGQDANLDRARAEMASYFGVTLP